MILIIFRLFDIVLLSLMQALHSSIAFFND